MKPLTIAVGAVLVAVATLATLTLPGLKDRSAEAGAASPQAIPPVPGPGPVRAAASPQAAAAGADQALPAWMGAGNGLGGDAKEPGVAAAARAGMPVIKPQLQAAMQRLDSLRQRGNPQPREVAEALLEVERANGSPVMGGVRLDVLRQNMAVVEKMKALADEVGAQGAQGLPVASGAPAAGPGSSRPGQPGEASAAMAARLEQIAVLQKQLRTDIMVAPAGAAP